MSSEPGERPADSEEQSEAVRETFAAAARRSAFGAVAPGEAPSSSALLSAIGGVRGILESVLPGIAFVLVYTITREILPSVIIPIVIALGFVVVRLFVRSPWTSAVVGVLGLAISATIALSTGRAEDSFIPGMVLNGVFLLGLVVSLIVRWPLVGIIASLIVADESGWRQNRTVFRAAVLSTLLWCGLFVLRLSVQLPLYFAGAVEALGTAKIVLGLPVYALVLWGTWLLMRKAYPKASVAAE